MKKIILLLNFLLFLGAVDFSVAQTHVLYGTCLSGGNYNWGTIFQANLDGSNLHPAYAFRNPEGAAPWGRIAQAPNGKIYGVTYLGGCMDSCTLYEYDPIADTCIDVYDFYCTNPISEPSQSGLTILPDGNIYGLEQNGIIYKFNPNTHVYTLLYQQLSGAVFNGGLIKTSNGRLYGISSYGGGPNSQGYIFSFDLSLNTYSPVYNFDGIHGAGSSHEYLIQATNGKLYGTTQNGGANNKGVIFSYDLSTNTYTDLYDFDVALGSVPEGSLIQATNGKLYGMTAAGGNNNYGVIFSYDISTSQYAVPYYFDGPNGSFPQVSLTQASNGKLFGTTNGGGTYNQGVAFSYDIATGTYTVLASFSTYSGANPQGDIYEAVLPVTEGISSVNSSSASIYVDAASQHLIIQNLQLNSSAQLIVYDAVGKNIFQSDINNQKSEFDLSSYPKGIYFVQLCNDGQRITKKIILSK